MKTPIHHFKWYTRYKDNYKPPRWSYDGRPCWLGSGMNDKNGKEIFEGDIVKNVIPPGYVQDDNLYIVYFRNCEFLLIREQDWICRKYCGATPLGWESSASIEVIGHIEEAEYETH